MASVRLHVSWRFTYVPCLLRSIPLQPQFGRTRSLDVRERYTYAAGALESTLNFAFLLLTARASAVTCHCLRLGYNMYPTSTFPLMNLDLTTPLSDLYISSFTALDLTQFAIGKIQAEISRLSRSRHGRKGPLHL
jgi:hypothetical protein